MVNKSPAEQSTTLYRQLFNIFQLDSYEKFLGGKRKTQIIVQM